MESLPIAARLDACSLTCSFNEHVIRLSHLEILRRPLEVNRGTFPSPLIVPPIEWSNSTASIVIYGMNDDRFLCCLYLPNLVLVSF
jgi:hypothetical protein